METLITGLFGICVILGIVMFILGCIVVSLKLIAVIAEMFGIDLPWDGSFY